MLYFVSRPLFEYYISRIARVKGSVLSGTGTDKSRDGKESIGARAKLKIV